MNGLYFIRINWYDEIEDNNKYNCAFVIAKTITEAVEKITADFSYINSLTIEDFIPNNYCNINAIYVPDDDYIIEGIRKENDF